MQEILSSRSIFSNFQLNKWITAIIIVVGIFLLCALAYMGQGRIALAVTFFSLFLAITTYSINAGIITVLTFLILVGDFRRILIPVVGWSGMDPLILLGTLFAALLFVYAFLNGLIKFDSTISRLIIALMVIMAIQVFNPLQGGLTVGVAGVIFLLAPLFWFWVGRSYISERFLESILFRLIIPFAILAMLFGFYQRFFGYLPYQMVWYDIGGYIALGDLDKGLAPITFFASGTEHGVFLTVATVILWASILRGKSNRLNIVLILIFFVAIFVSGIRGPVVKVLFVGLGMWALLGKSISAWFFRGSLALAVGAVLLLGGLSQIENLDTHPKIQHQLQRQAALLNSKDEGSPVSIHIQMMLEGYRDIFEYPLGRGLGSTSIAASKFGSKGYDTETDFGNVLVATGVLGGLAYHIAILLIVLTAFRYWLRTRSVLALALIGIIGVNFMSWLTGGHYFMSPFTWLCIGGLDRFMNSASYASDTGQRMI